MATSSGAYLRGIAASVAAAGEKVISSDFAFEIEGFENSWLLCKQAPWPQLSAQGEIEIPGPLGSKTFRPQQVGTGMQGAVSFFETKSGQIDQTLVNLIAGGGTFNAKVYEGTPQKYLCFKRLENCFVQLDNPDRDWENRSQPLIFSGTLFFHYYGEIEAGNSSNYS